MGGREDKRAAAYIRKLREQQAAQKAQARALKGFRPKKSERGTVVFLAAHPRHKGKPDRVSLSSRRKSYPVYITRTGKVYLVREQKQKILRQPHAPIAPVEPKKFQSDGAQVRSKGGYWSPKRALRRYRATRMPFATGELKASASKAPAKAGWDEQMVIKPKAGVRGLDWDQVVNTVSKKLGAGIAQQDKHSRQLVLHVVAFFEDVAGKRVVRWEDWIYFGQSIHQNLIARGFYEPFVKLAVYAKMAIWLKDQGFVSAGSAANIRALPQNAGKPVAQWTDKNGRPWDKGHLPVANHLILRTVHFRLERVTVKQI